MTIEFLLTVATGAATAFVLALALNEFYAARGIPRRHGFVVTREGDDPT